MDKNPADEIVITALLERFTKIRLPRAYDLEKKVLAGEKLSDNDITFLDSILSDAKYILGLSDKYPEYQEIVSNVIQMIGYL